MSTEAKPKILLVEDEPHLQYSLTLNLEGDGYEVFVAGDGLIAVELYNQHRPFSGVILDVMLPEMDGFEVAKRIRTLDAATGILMLTARAADEDRVAGLQAGVDDYITKPFHLEELLLKVKRMVDRATFIASGLQSLNDAIITYGPFSLNYDELSLDGPKGKHELTVLEADCLKAFMTNPARVLSRDYLLENVWRMRGHQETRTVDNFVMRLRRIIEDDPKRPVYLESVRGRGYRFVVIDEEVAN